MTKMEFTKIITSMMNELPLEKRKDFLYKCNDWIRSMQEKLDKELGKYCLCSKCKKYFLRKPAEKVREIVTYEKALVQSDYGYGDDDIVGNIDYFVTYLVCPKCGNKNKIEQKFIRSYNEHRRRW